MNLDEKEKKSILRVYDSLLDLCPSVSSKYFSILKDNYNFINKISFVAEHEKFDDHILHNALGNNSIKKTTGFSYIKNPDFSVKTKLYNPVYDSDFSHLASLSQCAYLIKTLDCYFELDTNDIIDRAIEPDRFGGSKDPRARLVAMIEAINHKKITEEDIYKILGFLDKGLIKIALRVSKVMIAPGVYALIEEFVPVDTTAFNEIYRSLMEKFHYKNSRFPSKDEEEAIKSEAIRLACDIQLDNGMIIKNPHTFDVLNGFEDKYTKEKSKFDYIFSNPNRQVVTNWAEYKTRVKSIYGKTWNDDYIDLSTNARLNIWNVSENIWFDNRRDYSLQEQRKKYHK